jgi:hypothetical protein
VANLGGNELLDGVAGFGDAVRSYMVGVLAITYQQIEVDPLRSCVATCPRFFSPLDTRPVCAWQSEVFMDVLALDEAHLAAYVKTKNGLLSVQGKFVVFAADGQNQPKPKTLKEGISFDKLLPVLGILGAP